MTTKNQATKHIPQFVPHNLPWHERDGLLTYIDELKYKRFCEYWDEHFKNPEVINFDIKIHRCRGTPLENTVQYYKTIKRKS